LETRLDLQPLWMAPHPDGGIAAALDHPWGPSHRPDWVQRGLIIWPRGGQRCSLRLRLACPAAWQAAWQADRQARWAGQVRARLALRWWAEDVKLLVDGVTVHRGDLFDTACRWPLPEHWWQGQALELELHLVSPLHDDGALIHSHLDLEPLDPQDPLGLLQPVVAQLEALRRHQGHGPEAGPGALHWLGHAHLDLAWLWPVADTWRAAERTFDSVLTLMQRFEELHFGHSTPALYAWLEQHRPALFERLQAAMASGRFEPLNGPWVETDAILIATASLLRQFQEGQHYSQSRFPQWEHALAWLPDSFGFGAGLPAVALATGVRWFCTHKLAWNATTPFPHRLFRWRSRCGAEVLALMTAPIGTDGDPVAIERYRLEWQRCSGVADALWLPGVGDHGGGPSAEMLEQLELWRQQGAAARQQPGTLRHYLAGLEPLAPRLPVWRDELFLELHRGCATSRPDQKRHNRSLERLLREAEVAQVLAGEGNLRGLPQGEVGPGEFASEPPLPGSPAPEAVDWRPLLFQQFHDILPGTAIPEVYDQAEPQWRAARRRARRQRDRALTAALGSPPGPVQGGEAWAVVQLQPLCAAPRSLRLPAGPWTPRNQDAPLASQDAPGGGQWVQLPPLAGIERLWLRRGCLGPAGPALPVQNPVQVLRDSDAADGPRWRLDNGLVGASIGPGGVERLWDGHGRQLLAGPLGWRRWRDQGEFWDAWDLAADYRDHPLPWIWSGAPQWRERGPLCASFTWRGCCGGSPVRLQGRLLAGCPWLELVLQVRWRQRHELLRLEVPLAQPACRWAADTSGGVIERPASARNPREQARWEVPAISWIASVSPDGIGDLALLLDGPQGVSGQAERLGVSLLRGPTWPDPGADNGLQRQRLALMPCPGGWRNAAVPAQALRLREPLWCRPLRAGATGDQRWTGLPPLAPDLQLVALRPAATQGEALLTVQNNGPCRRQLALGPHWQVLARCDGLERDLDGKRTDDNPAGNDLQGDQPNGPALTALGPWQLGFWRLKVNPRGRQTDR
jgi:alpha-mannosidase